MERGVDSYRRRRGMLLPTSTMPRGRITSLHLQSFRSDRHWRQGDGREGWRDWGRAEGANYQRS